MRSSCRGQLRGCNRNVASGTPSLASLQPSRLIARDGNSLFARTDSLATGVLWSTRLSGAVFFGPGTTRASGICHTAGPTLPADSSHTVGYVCYSNYRTCNINCPWDLVAQPGRALSRTRTGVGHCLPRCAGCLCAAAVAAKALVMAWWHAMVALYII